MTNSDPVFDIRTDSGGSSRHELILARAAELFAESGYRSTSLNDLARAAGIAKPTLFHYFDSKNDILFSLYARTMELALKRIRSSLDPELPPVENVANAIRTHTLLILEHRDLFTILFDEESELTDQQRESILEQQAQYLHIVGAELHALKSQGRFNESVSVNIAMQGLIGMASWVYRWYDPHGRLSPEEIADMFASLAVQGVTDGLYTEHVSTA